jgi:hypothetical protein
LFWLATAFDDLIPGGHMALLPLPLGNGSDSVAKQ